MSRNNGGAYATDRIGRFVNIRFETNADITAFTREGRELYRGLFMHLLFAGSELRAVLSKAPTPPGGNFLSPRVRAVKVAVHLFLAAELTRRAGMQIVKTRESFHRHFAPELQHVGARRAAAKPKFRWVPE